MLPVELTEQDLIAAQRLAGAVDTCPGPAVAIAVPLIVPPLSVPVMGGNQEPVGDNYADPAVAADRRVAAIAVGAGFAVARAAIAAGRVGSQCRRIEIDP